MDILTKKERAYLAPLAERIKDDLSDYQNTMIGDYGILREGWRDDVPSPNEAWQEQALGRLKFQLEQFFWTALKQAEDYLDELKEEA